MGERPQRSNRETRDVETLLWPRMQTNMMDTNPNVVVPSVRRRYRLRRPITYLTETPRNSQVLETYPVLALRARWPPVVAALLWLLPLRTECLLEEGCRQTQIHQKAKIWVVNVHQVAKEQTPCGKHGMRQRGARDFSLRGPGQ
jgi:hypothetical protein